jgi:hypothetical protein
MGRIIDHISHGNVQCSSAIFIEEDDAQNGVDHVDRHHSPGYIVSPHAVQNVSADQTYYTQVDPRPRAKSRAAMIYSRTQCENG